MMAVPNDGVVTVNQKKILTDVLQKQTSRFNENKVIALNRICGEPTCNDLSLHCVQEMKN